MNQFSDILRVKVQEARTSLIEDNKPVMAEALQQVLTGKDKAKRMLLEIFQHHNNNMKVLVGREFAAGTLERYQTSLEHTRSFLLWKYNVSDMEIQQLNYEFISEYAFWFKSVRQWKTCIHPLCFQIATPSCFLPLTHNLSLFR